jgi:hypothetical protein
MSISGIVVLQFTSNELNWVHKARRDGFAIPS